MRKVLGEWIRQFTCPSCKIIGAGDPAHLPLCHICNYKVKMLPSHNGEILENWREVHEREKRIIEHENP